MKTSEYLKINTINHLENITMENPFKNYRPLDLGNSKLEANIASFSLIPVSTCGMDCSGCYDKRALRYPSVQDKRKYNTWLSIHKKDFLKSKIITQISNSKKIKFVRIHVGGDFYSIDYINMWAEIVNEVSKVRKDVIFYTYTKSKYAELLEFAGINVVKSIVKGLGLNFGKIEKLEKFIESNPEYLICPATKKENVKCGKTCTACMTTNKVLFVQH